MESGVDLKSVNKGWGKAPKSVMWSVGMGAVDGERREVGQAEEMETRKRASCSIYTFCKLGQFKICEIIST